MIVISKFTKNRILFGIAMVFVFLTSSLVFDSMEAIGYKDSDHNVAFAAEITSENQITSDEFMDFDISYTKLLAAKPSSGVFKSGDFSSLKEGSSDTKSKNDSKDNPSKAAPGGFKSGGFSNTKETDNAKSDKDSKSSSDGSKYENSKKSFIPIPIPFFGGRARVGSYGGSTSFIGGMFKLLVYIILIVIIINVIRKYIKRKN
ncbi:hypothetical protein [Clostridium algidicarnis]|uniref:hypothetical protein n=1 Tax=Clostridium algidicarnis TaxID=37659 RepID=UPI001C0D5445|nr:hypothetical protein [Clostridium algidicarnis]MBU3229206.1 hypothetical protein [Clostridium algidicarnis]MBU3252720.1 hypothetical protein [Clostridium algidicarnis]